MRITAGITGFRQAHDDELTRVNYSAFRRLAYAFAQHMGATVQEVEKDGTARSYYAANVVSDQSRTLLCNAYQPIISWSTNALHSHFDPHFIDLPQTHVVLASFSNFYTVSAEELNAPVSHQNLSTLNAVEQAQVAYWKPPTLGALIFNCWD